MGPGFRIWSLGFRVEIPEFEFGGWRHGVTTERFAVEVRGLKIWCSEYTRSLQQFRD